MTTLQINYVPLSCTLDYSDNILLSPKVLYMYMHENYPFCGYIKAFNTKPLRERKENCIRRAWQ